MANSSSAKLFFYSAFYAVICSSHAYPLSTSAPADTEPIIYDEEYTPPDTSSPVSILLNCVPYNEPCDVLRDKCCSGTCISAQWEGEGEFRCLPKPPVCYSTNEQCAGSFGKPYVRKCERRQCARSCVPNILDRCLDWILRPREGIFANRDWLRCPNPLSQRVYLVHISFQRLLQCKQRVH
jgi:hypothetical protein